MSELPRRIIGFLVDSNNQVLLGQKKEGIGEGKYIGIGGKIDEGETDEQTLVREIEEEIGVIALEYSCMGSLKFVFPHKPEWTQEVIPFVITKWKSDPIETDEMRPKWFDKNHLPLEQMWDDAPYWIPDMLGGNRVEKELVYGGDNQTVSLIV